MRAFLKHTLLLLFLISQSSLNASVATDQQPLLDSLQSKIIKISDEVKGSVVHIKAVLKQQGRKLEVSGSGVIMDSAGNVITNHHVVERAEQIEVFVPGFKKPFTARLQGFDRQTDLALIKIIDGKKFKVPTFGDSSGVKVGEWVLAVGNPYGLEGTVSFGIVSAKGRNLPVDDLINDFIQTDAMIDFGSSGGPLVNMQGSVVGINSRTQGRGIGFTIPINTVLKVKEELSRMGKLERSWLGISIQPLGRELADYLGVTKETGVIVNSILDASPASKVDLKVGDVITHFGNKRLAAENDKEIKEVLRLIAESPTNKKIKLRRLRGKKGKNIFVRLTKQPKTDDNETEIEEWGVSVKEITYDLLYSYRLPGLSGVFVSFVGEGSPASQAGLEHGDVIHAIGETKTSKLATFKQRVAELKPKERVLLVVNRGRDRVFLLLKPPAEQQTKQKARAAYHKHDKPN